MPTNLLNHSHLSEGARALTQLSALGISLVVSTLYAQVLHNSSLITQSPREGQIFAVPIQDLTTNSMW